MKKRIRIDILVIIVSFLILLTSCELFEDYPKLKVVNQYADKYISAVSLIGYQFDNLHIDSGHSQTFALDNGMPGGYNDINILVTYRAPFASWNISNSFDFYDGETTTITLKEFPSISLE